MPKSKISKTTKPQKPFSKIKIPISHTYSQASWTLQTYISQICNTPTATYTSWTCILHIQVCILHTSVYLTVVHLTNVYLIGVCLMGMYLIGVYLTDVYLTGVHLMSVHLIGVYLMGVYLVVSSSRSSKVPAQLTFR
jgi:hypothetical protein